MQGSRIDTWNDDNSNVKKSIYLHDNGMNSQIMSPPSYQVINPNHSMLSLPSQQFQQVMDANCYYHKERLITNFCENQECLLPMCPLCVKEHNAVHAEMGTQSHFETIEDSKRQLMTDLSNIKRALEFYHNQFSQYNKDQYVDQSNIVQQLEAIKAQFNEHIDEILMQIHNNMNKDTNNLLKGMSKNMRRHEQDYQNCIRELEHYERQMIQPNNLKPMIEIKQDQKIQKYRNIIENDRQLYMVMNNRDDEIKLDQNLIPQFENLVRNMITIKQIQIDDQSKFQHSQMANQNIQASQYNQQNGGVHNYQRQQQHNNYQGNGSYQANPNYQQNTGKYI